MFGVPKHIVLKMTIRRINVMQKTVGKLIFRLVKPKILKNEQMRKILGSKTPKNDLGW